MKHSSPPEEGPATASIECLVTDQNLLDHELVGSYATPGSAAFDLRASLKEKAIIEPGETRIIQTGLSIWIRDPKLVGILVPRSSVGIKLGLSLANTIGVIDSDYQGPLAMAAHNYTNSDVEVFPYHRLCQLMIVPVIQARLNIVDQFTDQTARGTGGLGSTGTF